MVYIHIARCAFARSHLACFQLTLPRSSCPRTSTSIKVGLDLTPSLQAYVNRQVHNIKPRLKIVPSSSRRDLATINENFIEKRHGIYTHSEVCLRLLTSSLFSIDTPEVLLSTNEYEYQSRSRSHSQLASVPRLVEAECNFLIDALVYILGMEIDPIGKYSYAIQCQYLRFLCTNIRGTRT